MTDIGVRELKRDLSGYLRRAASGERVRVTVRGEPFVELVAAAPVDDAARVAAHLARLEAQGAITPSPAAVESRVVRQHDFRLDRSPTGVVLDEREGGR